MTIKELKKYKKILIIGYGVEGKAAEVFLKKNVPDAEIDIVDMTDGKGYLDKQKDYDLAIKSPGVKSGLVTIPYTTVINIFMSNYKGKIIGITGTKGKGTTASLIYEMLKTAGRDLPAGRQGVYLGGNIGVPPLDFLDKLNNDSIVILELSSFQLQDLDKSPHIAVMLMTTSEHLDYHKDVSEYVEAKRNILKHQTKDDFAIVNRDYPASNEADIFSEGKVYYISRERTGADGCFVRDNAIWIQIEGGEKKIIDTKEILLPGKHNLENVCAAAMTAYLTGVEREHIEQALKTFKGLEHRLELIKEINGVKYYDDSFSTIPETTIAAIEAFTAPEILILGGSSKNSDFGELGRIISGSNNIKAIIGIGDEWHRMRAEFPISNFQFPIIEDAVDMKTVVLAASKIAQPGDVVLLSPACASFGMFKNYKDRGEQFKKEVLALA